MYFNELSLHWSAVKCKKKLHCMSGMQCKQILMGWWLFSIWAEATRNKDCWFTCKIIFLGIHHRTQRLFISISIGLCCHLQVIGPWQDKKKKIAFCFFVASCKTTNEEVASVYPLWWWSPKALHMMAGKPSPKPTGYNLLWLHEKPSAWRLWL